MVTTVEVGDHLSDRKGVSIPDTTISFGALTPKDRADLEAALNTGIDWIALSFVQRAEDLSEVRKLARGRAGILAKIEKPQAVERLAAIVEHADALMVARGDLGVEMPLERVPGIQKQITRACRRAGKPVVVATQMLESMIAAPVPTRAEVSDVATAVFEGCDAVMLSAESASGAFPVEAVATMDKVATEVERDPNYVNILRAQRTEPEATSFRRHLGGDAADRRDAEPRRHLLLHGLRQHRRARLARAAQHADPGPVAGGLHRPPPVAGLGTALRLRRGAGQSRRHGQPRLRHGPSRGPRRARRPGHHHRRLAARHPRRDQHAAHRLRHRRRLRQRRPETGQIPLPSLSSSSRRLTSTSSRQGSIASD